MWMIFDIETVPDADSGRAWLKLPNSAPDHEVRTSMVQQRIEETGGSSFLKPGFHQVVSIAAAIVDDSGALRRLTALGRLDSSESELVKEFFRIISDAHPRLVGWNSSGFDLPTLVLRAVLHGIAAPEFYRFGEPYHGYRKRFDEESHIDLMDVLSGYGAAPRMSLHEMACMMKMPGKLEVSGKDVADLYQGNQIQEIRDYCELDVLTTTLIFASYAYHRQWFNEDQKHAFDHSVNTFLTNHHETHWKMFARRWLELSSENQ
ncbi:MAG: 3'-5' exonuclease [Sulfobacillus benefaciens]|uniref:3'-5' exonuclease n=1 Tax=Sulfobacillus benefaciens TaxID=453960 RepID=A0A2T2XCD0_9FIRM|nr:MAG: 3'-5' exonuclease [Sulfobacillus benefaciens]